MKIGITGHQSIDEPSRWAGVKAKIHEILSDAERPLIGVTSLAIGADQEFADAVLEQDGKIEVIVPFEGYELVFEEGPHRERYRRLLDRAARVEVLPEVGSNAEAYYQAGKAIVDRCDLLLAVWDGRPPDGRGGTADVVEYARTQGKTMVRIDPSTA